MMTGTTENTERRGTGKYEALLARCKDTAAVPTAVAHPCDDASLGDPGFAALVRSWMELSGVLNELSRSMGVTDFYPFVLSPQAVRKLHAVHRLITALG